MSNFITNLDSVAAIQKVELNHRVLVLVQLSGIRLIGGAEVCEFVMETDKINFFGWESHGGSGSCHKINDPADTQSITTGISRSGSSPQDPGYSAVYGNVRDPQITHVLVTWEDGRVQSVAVLKSTYIAVREGGFDIKKVEAQ